MTQNPDLESDPDELHNLWDSATHGGLRSELMTELVREMTHHGDTSPYPTALA